MWFLYSSISTKNSDFSLTLAVPLSEACQFESVSKCCSTIFGLGLSHFHECCQEKQHSVNFEVLMLDGDSKPWKARISKENESVKLYKLNLISTFKCYCYVVWNKWKKNPENLGIDKCQLAVMMFWASRHEENYNQHWKKLSEEQGISKPRHK